MALPAIEVEVTADTSQAEAGLDRVGSASNRLGGQLRRAQRSTAQFQHGIQNAAFQVGDFAVQVGGGVDASRALAQQLPQLLGGLGVFGALAGAAVAVVVPLASAMQDMTIQGRDASEMFGTLTPLMEGLASAARTAGALVRDFAEVVINNIDRILTIGATAAAFFAGKWVAGFIAARVATFSLATALVTLRGALIRTGIGALVVGAGELVFQFTRLVQAAGGFGEAMGLLGDVAREVIDRIKLRVEGLEVGFKLVMNDISFAWVTWLGNLQTSFARFVDGLAGTSIGKAMGLEGGNVDAALKSTAEAMAGVTDEMVTLLARQDEISAALGAPMESIQAIRDLLTNMKEEGLSLDDIIFGGDDEDEDGGKKIQEKLDDQAKRIKEHFDRIRALSTGGLSDQLGGWSDYFSNLVSLTGKSHEKLLRVSKAFKAAQALIDAWSAYNQVLADPSLPFFAKFAAGAQVLAAGMGAVNAISSVNASAGGGAGASGAGAASAAASAPPPTQNVVLDLRNASADTTRQVGSLVEMINEAGRQGYVLDIRTAR